MKTLHLTNSWHPRSGGVRTFYTALFEAAEARGHQVRLVVPGEQTRIERVGRHGIVYHIEAPRAPMSPSYRVLYPHRLILPGSPVMRILREERPDLVEVCDKFTMNYLGGLLRVGLIPGLDFRPAVVGLSCERLDRTVDTYVGSSRILAALSRTYLRWLYFPLADHHIAVSEFVAAELRAVSDGHKVDRGVWVAPMGVDTAVFGKAQRRWEVRRDLLALTGAGEGAVILVYAGRLAHEKNLPLLLETARLLQDRPDGHRYRLLLVGDGDARAALQRQAESTLPGMVHFAGYRDTPSSLADLLAACDLFVHPNPCEPFGIAPLEAMACGLPLVAPDSGGVLSYASSGNAWLAAPEPAAFARTIVNAVANQKERKRRSAQARLTAESFAWPAAAARYLDLYEHIHSRVVHAKTRQDLEPAFYSTR